MNTPASRLSARPYRSHRIPACDICRRRKIRCNVDVPGQPCRFCRESDRDCKYNNTSSQPHSPGPRNRVPKSRNSTSAAKKGVRTSTTNPNGSTEQSLARFPGLTGGSPNESSVMMNPPMAEDIAVLKQYLTSRTSDGRAMAKPYSTISDAPGNPIVYLTVPKRRKGLRIAADPGRTQREIIEQVLHPFAAEVRKLFFEHVHPCFPVVDETTFMDMWARDHDRISSTLVCDLYATASLFWDRDEKLCSYAQPDLDFIWNQAVAALQEDFLAPSISTVHAALLDLVGRPVLAVTGNIANVGRVVTLAHSLGLHRDPTAWKATAHEKNARIRLWWGVLIHDHWSSIGHGIPSSINRQCYDVPLPSLDSLLTHPASETTLRTTASFLHLCKLSQILGDILPCVYTLHPDNESVWRTLRRVECALDGWLDGLPSFLDLSAAGSAGVNGASNLWFGYLSIKMLCCRVAFKATLREASHTNTEARQYRLAMLRESACNATQFVAELTDDQLREFWMPYTSYLLLSIVTVLLRCSVEISDPTTRSTCIDAMLRFRSRLRSAQQEAAWDLADFCLERCDEPIRKVAEVLGAQMAADVVPEAMTEDVGASCEEGFRFEDLLPGDALGVPWEVGWEFGETGWFGTD